MKLAKKVAVVTGAGSGIGAGIAKEMLREGASVVVATLLPDEGKSVEAALRQAGGQAVFIQTDVRSESSIKEMVDQAVRYYGAIDILINNAGITVFKPMLEATADDWEDVISVDLRGVFFCSKYISELMKDRRSGSIINIASIHASVTFPHAEMYAAAKSGIIGMTRSMALSLGPYDIRVNAISPGFIETSERFKRWGEVASRGATRLQNLLDSQALKHVCQPEDVGRLAVFLSSEEARMITGEEVMIDGGSSVRLQAP